MSQDSGPDGLLALIGSTGDQVALVEPVSGDRVSYADLHDVVDRIARQLAGLGLRPGDAVALRAANGPEIVAAFLGIVAAGASAAPLNPAYKTSELDSYLADLRPVAMLLDDPGDAEARAACAALEIPVYELVGPDTRSLTLRDVVPASDGSGADPDAVALLLHTSGTTSAPKGVPIRNRNLAASAQTIARTYELGRSDVSYCVMPLFHVHGLVASTLAPLASSGTVVIPRRFSATSFWDDVHRFGVTWFSAVPTIHRTLTLREERAGGSESPLRFARSCSSALPASVWERFESRFEVPLVEAYGMTEAAHQMASNPLPPGERRPGTVGCATGIDVAVLDDDWNQLPAGRLGEVAVRGPSVVDRYRNAPEANVASFRNGWFRTGDQGVLSEDGYLKLEGRIKELINRGGEKISPHEVEDALLRHPAVIDAVAFALPDDKYGEQVGAAVVVRGELASDALAKHSSQQLADFKVPTRIVVLDEIPKGPTGKVQRRLLADQLS